MLRWLYTLPLRWRTLLARKRVEEELDEEVRYHLERQIEQHISQGLTPEQARDAAYRAFGNTSHTKEVARDTWGWRHAEILLRDLKHAERSLLKNPGFSIVAISLIALSIGSNLAVFSVMDPLLLRPLPVDRPQELVRLVSVDRNGREGPMRSQVLDTLRTEPFFRGICGFSAPSFATDLGGSIHSPRLLAMSGDCFQTLGVRARIGRLLTIEDEKPGAEKVALLSSSAWHNTFGDASAVLGTKPRIGRETFTIVGVTEQRFMGFSPASAPELIIPLAQMPLDFVPTSPVYFPIDIYARKTPGVSVEQVQSRMASLEKELFSRTVPPRYNEAQRRDYLAQGISVSAAPNSTDRWVSRRFGPPLFATMALCALVLIVTLVNVAILTLSRSLSRRKEVSVRLALGATRLSVARMLAMEVVLLVAVGVLAGVMLARIASLRIVNQAQQMVALTLDPFSIETLDSRSLLFFAGMVVLTVLALCAVPAVEVLRFHRNRMLVNSERGVLATGTRTQGILLCLQIALALMLVSGGSLLNSSVAYLYDIAGGANVQGVSMARLTPLPDASLNAPAGPYNAGLIERIEAVPGVTSTALTNYAPFYNSVNLSPVSAVENPLPVGLRAQTIAVTERFFETLGVPIVDGDVFRADSGLDEAIVSRSLAAALGGNVIGRHIRVGDPESERNLHIIGVAGNVPLSTVDPTDTEPLSIYTNLWRQPNLRFPVLLMKAAGGASFPVAAIRNAVKSQGRHYLETYRTLAEQRDQSIAENVLLAHASTAFGVLSLVLAATGLFGLLSHQVGLRRGEIGVRMALGAQRRQIQWLIVRQMLGLLVVGLGAGMALVLLSGSALAGLVFGVSVYDPRVLGASIAVLIVTAALAAWLPAHRASSVDPLVVLRHE